MSKELSPKEALEKLTNYGCSKMSEKIQCKEIIETALNRLEELEKILRNKLYYSPTCFNVCGKTYIDLMVEDDEPEFELLKEYLK